MNVCPDPTGELAKTAGDCAQRPCFCGIAVVMGCDCGFYLDSARRKTGHHWRDCAFFSKAVGDV